MLASSGSKRNRLDLVKLIFLLSEEHALLPATARYEFVPYKRGPYSFTLYHDLAALERNGCIIIGEYDVALTLLGKSEAERTSQDTVRAVDQVRNSYGNLDTENLIDYVYDKFPWYTLNSEWIERRKASRPLAETQVYTIGYESISIDGLINCLLKRGLRRLIDVRANPVSRRYGFHKSTLSNNCPKVGIEYVHIPEVGVPSAWRAELGSAASYQKLFKRYASEVLQNQSEYVQHAASLIVSAPSALMCKEANSQCCHRTILAEAICRLTGLEVEEL